MWQRKPAKQSVIARVIKVFLSSNRYSLTTNQICGILREQGNDDVQDALAELRDDGIIACSDGQWWMRERKINVRTGTNSE